MKNTLVIILLIFSKFIYSQQPVNELYKYNSHQIGDALNEFSLFMNNKLYVLYDYKDSIDNFHSIGLTIVDKIDSKELKLFNLKDSNTVVIDAKQCDIYLYALIKKQPQSYEASEIFFLAKIDTSGKVIDTVRIEGYPSEIIVDKTINITYSIRKRLYGVNINDNFLSELRIMTLDKCFKIIKNIELYPCQSAASALVSISSSFKLKKYNNQYYFLYNAQKTGGIELRVAILDTNFHVVDNKLISDVNALLRDYFQISPMEFLFIPYPTSNRNIEFAYIYNINNNEVTKSSIEISNFNRSININNNIYIGKILYKNIFTLSRFDVSNKSWVEYTFTLPDNSYCNSFNLTTDINQNIYLTINNCTKGMPTCYVYKINNV